ncbi:acyl-CoA N-acyltransferase [Penicillium maclennaniae]|uniref:acyl-CoA N-acyltransferase n=1 Tax=Penicillium maclennaniae TaxID=1343394 RepID=UPI00253FE85D|nr:acyl-CoA N-acyltransferase [Penicillium maclennaniae]KAJ5681659.1 acyl-CoA N-acyltransferase [Penicillium maclennaniae]
MAAVDLNFRAATLEDAPQLQELVQNAFRAADSRSDWTGDMGLASQFHISVEEIKSFMNGPESAFLIATDQNGVMMGTIGVSKRGANGARLSMLAVDHRYHRGGLGRQILGYAEDYSYQTWGATKAGLNALSTRQTLIAWYMRRGYKKTGETSPFPRKRFPDLDLPEDMCFVEFEKDLDPVAVAA